MQKGLCLMKNKGVIEDIFPQNVHSSSYSSALWNWIMDRLQLFCNIKGKYVLSMAAGMVEARRRHMFFYGLL